MRLPIVLVAAATALLPAAPVQAAGPPAVLVGCVGHDIGLFPPDGGPPTVIAYNGYDPDVSPDGRRVAYVDMYDKFGVITVVNLATGVRRTLDATETFAAPDWSPDNHTLALEARAEPSGLGLIDVDAADAPVRMVPGSAGMYGPSWSPDGAYLAAGTHAGVEVIRPDGRDRALVVPSGGTPAWSPDGRTIAYYFNDIEGDIRARFLPDLADRPFLSSAGMRAGYGDPAWSPDAAYIYGVFHYNYFDWDNPTAPAPTGNYIIRKPWGTPESYDYDTSYKTSENTACPSLGGGVPPAKDTSPPDAVPLSLHPSPSRLEVTARQSAPDAAGVIVRYAEGTVAPLTPMDGLDGGRPLLGHTVLPRLAASTTYAVSVFPIDWSGNIGPATSATATTPVEVATSLAVRPPVRYIVAGQSVDVAGQLRREDDGTPIAGAPVDLLAHRAGQPDALIATLVTDTDGRVTSHRSPLAPTRYTLRYAGSGALLPATGNSLVVVTPEVRLTLSRNPVPRGAPASLLVQVRPSRPGLNVRVYQLRSNGTAVRSPLVQLDARSSARVALDTRVRGTFHLYVMTGTNRDLASRTVDGPQLTVR
jgi:hypothetical protein